MLIRYFPLPEKLQTTKKEEFYGKCIIQKVSLTTLLHFCLLRTEKLNWIWAPMLVTSYKAGLKWHHPSNVMPHHWKTGFMCLQSRQNSQDLIRAPVPIREKKITLKSNVIVVRAGLFVWSPFVIDSPLRMGWVSRPAGQKECPWSFSCWSERLSKTVPPYHRAVVTCVGDCSVRIHLLALAWHIPHHMFDCHMSDQ